MEHEKIVAAHLGKRERYMTYILGYGIIIGLPAVIGISMALTSRIALFLFFPLPFALILFIVWGLRPVGYRITDDKLSVLRHWGRVDAATADLTAVHSEFEQPQGMTFGIFRSDGVFGTFGWYWNKSWGSFYVYVTDINKSLVLEFANHPRMVVSPDDKDIFIAALESATAANGRELKIVYDPLPARHPSI